ncbi:MAG: hypothetical protein KC561_21020, partial [Myxococcales bacterium]|nr:hypothetical protein [Myxococcales bacterium]
MAPGNLLVPRSYAIRDEDANDGGTFVRAWVADLPNLHPIVSNANNITEIQRYTNRALSYRDRHEPDNFIPEIAYRVEPNDDYTQYHVWLRDGVMWQRPAVDFNDPRYAWLEGEHEVVSDDFVFFLEAVMNPGVDAAHLANYFEEFDHIEVINDHEFIVHWKSSTYISIEFTLGLEPLPRWLYAYDEDGNEYSEEEFPSAFNQHWYQDRSIGCGPYRFVRWEPGVSIELARNEDYFDEKPPIERVVFRIIGDPNTRVNNLLSSDIEYTEFLPLQYSQYVLNEGNPAFHDGTIETGTYQGTVYRYLGWNAERPMFRDRRVR